jgi:hypothetical protein
MSERDEPGDSVHIFRTAAPYPVEWCVVCPTCGETVDCTLSQNDSGAYQSGDADGNPFVDCECGTTIEPLPVSLSLCRATRITKT